MKTTNTLIQVYLVRDVDIHSMETKYKNPLLTVPGTTKLHQIFIDKPDVIKYRDVSCVCYKQCCKDHQLQTFSLLPGTKAEESKRVFSKGKSETNRKQDNSFKDIPVTDEKKKQTTLNGRTDEDLQEVRRKEGTFRRILKSLQARDTFINLKKQCAIIKNQIGYTHGTPRSYHNFQAEPILQSILPNNIYVNGDTAVKVKADGDCLLACGSVFAYGNNLHVFEMRIQIVAELTLNEESK
ncbi:hypothetical protein ACJMK2_011875 [Sinanodonta woodiana]|uniref:Uncharacterized protein n=1 Tax=Sinanodonta woodiana TaxID=1069815 RepID=A0ABD3V8T5_SINWO